jgi:hypothetical protein
MATPWPVGETRTVTWKDVFRGDPLWSAERTRAAAREAGYPYFVGPDGWVWATHEVLYSRTPLAADELDRHCRLTKEADGWRASVSPGPAVCLVIESYWVEHGDGLYYRPWPDNGFVKAAFSTPAAAAAFVRDTHLETAMQIATEVADSPFQLFDDEDDEVAVFGTSYAAWLDRLADFRTETMQVYGPPPAQYTRWRLDRWWRDLVGHNDLAQEIRRWVVGSLKLEVLAVVEQELNPTWTPPPSSRPSSAPTSPVPSPGS